MVDSVTSASSSTSNADVLAAFRAQQAQNAAADKAKAASATSIAGLSGSFNTFLKILTTQLTHQDPTAATDTNQFTQELVQFSQVEQQLNTNGKLDQLVNLQKGSTNITNAINYIGKFVEVASANTVPLQNKQAELAYTLPSNAKTVSIDVLDSTGKNLVTLTGPTATGLQRVAWDGKDRNGTQVADGAYTFQLVAKDVAGNKLDVKDVRALGRVTSVQTNADGTTGLSLGDGLSITTDKVDAVYDSNSLPLATLGNAPAKTTTTTTSPPTT